MTGWRLCLKTALAATAMLPLTGCIPPAPTMSAAPVTALTWSRAVILDEARLLSDRERTRLQDFFQRRASTSADRLVTIVPAFGFRPAAVGIEASSGLPNDINEQPTGEPFIFGRRWVGVYTITIIPSAGQQPLTLKSSLIATRAGREGTRKATFEAIMRELASRFADPR